MAVGGESAGEMDVAGVLQESSEGKMRGSK